MGHIVKAIASPIQPPDASKTLYRERTVNECPLPEDPDVTLRRTVIDEVIVNKKPEPPRVK
jgi:hypothetical protein